MFVKWNKVKFIESKKMKKQNNDKLIKTILDNFQVSSIRLN